MVIKTLNLWYMTRSSYWFLPSLMAAMSVILAFTTLTIDEMVGIEPGETLQIFLATRAEGARMVLSAVAGSMITIAGVVFSITIVSLSLASSQFGPRLLASFMRDTGNQIVLGTFIATFLYCVLVLLSIQEGENEFVPEVSIIVAMILTIMSIAVLIYFIHHSSASIQVNNLIAKVGGDLERAIDRLFPEHIGSEPDEEASEQDQDGLPEGFGQEAHQVTANAKGYIQAVDSDGIMEVAIKHDMVLWLRQRPGSFIVRGSCLALAWPGSSMNDDIAREINRSIIVGKQRTLEQDVLFAFNELVEIAVRALSPGINDPFTANSCVNQIGSGLCQLAGRSIPSPYRYDDEGNLRVIAEPASFEYALNESFDAVRHNARSSASVTAHLMETLEVIAEQARRRQDRIAVLRQADALLRVSRDNLREEIDREKVEKSYRNVVATLGQQPTDARPLFTA